MKNTIILVRHGESDYNFKSIIQGNSNYSRLTDFGVKQAETVGDWLSELNITTVYSSPLQRAIETTRIIANKCGISHNTLQIDKRLEEVNFGSWQGQNRNQVKKEQGELYDIWRKRPFDFSIDDKFPVRETYQNISAFINEELSKYNNTNGKIIVIVGHKGTISALINLLLKLPKSHHHFLQIDRGSVSVLQERYNSSYELVFANELPQKEDMQPINFVTEERTVSKGEVFLVRHGQTESNIEKKYQGSKDIPLSALGVQEMQFLASSFTPRLPTRIFSSPLIRAKNSANIIAEKNNIKSVGIINELHEIIYGVWEGMTEEEVITNRSSEYYQWQSLPTQTFIPQAEQLVDAYNRCSNIWEYFSNDVKEWGGSIISVAHDIVNRLIICSALDLPPSYIWAFKQTNATISVLAVKQIIDGKLRMLNHCAKPIKKRLYDEWL